jgi:hypothetical protein
MRVLTPAIAAIAAIAGCSASPRIPDQPIAFDHALHLGLDVDGKQLACTACHPGAERAEHAGLPSMRDCLRCHVRPQLGADGIASPREALVRDLAAAGPVRWVQVTRNPGHVYAPHRAHVGLARMACAECHGDVTRWTAPPKTPNQRLTRMSECIACHEARGAPATCGTCHR